MDSKTKGPEAIDPCIQAIFEGAKLDKYTKEIIRVYKLHKGMCMSGYVGMICAWFIIL